MANQINESNSEKSRTSRIQIEVRELPRQTSTRNMTTRLDVDSDGSDISNE